MNLLKFELNNDYSWFWWLRSVYKTTLGTVGSVFSDGRVGNSFYNDRNGIIPVCII